MAEARTRRRFTLSPKQLAERNARIVAYRQGGMLSAEIGVIEDLTTPYVIKLLSKLRRAGADIPKHHSSSGGGPQKPFIPMARASGMIGTCSATVHSSEMDRAQKFLDGLILCHGG